jgi:hypothetical protein
LLRIFGPNAEEESGGRGRGRGMKGEDCMASFMILLSYFSFTIKFEGGGSTR